MNVVLWIGGVFIVCFGLIVLRGAPYVPSHKKQLKKAFRDLYPLSSKDTLVDLGSGDGIVLREARRKGARAIGYELNPILVGVSRLLSWNDNRIRVFVKDYLRVSTLSPEATVVYAFTTSRSIEAIDHKCLEWRKARNEPLYFISYGFTLADKKALRSVGPMHLYLYK